MNSRDIRATSWYRYLWAGLYLLVSALGVALIVGARQYVAGALLFGIGTIFAYRATKLRMTVTNSQVVIDSWLSRRRIERSAITRFESGDYVPIFLKGATTSALRVLCIIVDNGETRDVPFLIGRGRIIRLVYELNAGFTSEEPGDGPHHRAS
jgi:hypothetical protein